MTTFTMRSTGVCAGGLHRGVAADVNAVNRANVTVTPEDFTGSPSDDDIRTAIVILLRLYKIGRTNAQVATALQIGIDVEL